jgi:hypothetical protein
MARERYFSTVEYLDRFGRANRQLEVFSNKGKMPNIGDLIEAFSQVGLDVEIKDFITMTFKPKDPTKTHVISLKVIRTIRDYSYKPTLNKEAII